MLQMGELLKALQEVLADLETVKKSRGVSRKVLETKTQSFGPLT